MRYFNLSHTENNVNTEYLFGKIFKTTFLFIFLAELLSLWGYLLPAFNGIAFFVIAGLALALSLQKLEYGIYIVLAELFIGSKGYLFFFEHNGFVISIRIALWLIVMAVWLGKVISDWIKNKKLKIEFFQSSYFYYFFILFLFILWGAVNGILNNELGNVFFDFNNWLYFLLVFPVYHIAKSTQSSIPPTPFIKGALEIFTAAIIWLCVKTVFLLFIFSHNMIGMVYEIYRWTRVSGVGEITLIQNGFYRIFFQSHIFVLIGFFIFFVLIINHNKITKTFIYYFLLLTLFLSVIIITFSRSFWVGFIFGLAAVFTYLIWRKTSPPSSAKSADYGEARWKKILQISGMLIVCAAASFILIFAIVKFPYPSPTAGFSISLLSDRAGDISEGAAVSSRWNLLPELWKEIKSAPILGKGFGATVTYTSNDPRVLETSPTGKYTTYAFEWGWLDIWLKMGALGLLAYLVLLSKIIYDGIRLNYELRIMNYEYFIVFGLIISLAVVAVVSIFSPYMNHPLGVGYLILVSAVVESLERKKAQ